MIHDFAIRRALMGLGRDITDKAVRVDVESDPSEQIVEAEQALYRLSDSGRTQQGFQSFLRAGDRRGADRPMPPTCAKAGLRASRPASPTSTRNFGGLHKSDLLILAGPPLAWARPRSRRTSPFNIAKTYRRGPAPPTARTAR